MTTKQENDGCPGFEGREANCNLQSAAPHSVVLPVADEVLLPRPVELPTQFDGTSMPADWIEELRWRDNQPMATSAEYDRTIEACVAEHEARRKRKHNDYALSVSFLELRHWAWLFALMVGLAIFFWLGLEVVEAAASLLANAAAR